MSRATMKREQAEARAREEHWALVADRNRLRDEVDALVDLNAARDITILNLRALLERADHRLEHQDPECDCSEGDNCDARAHFQLVADIRRELGK